MQLRVGVVVAALVGCATGAGDPDGGPGSGDGGIGADATGTDAQAGLAVTSPNGGELWINGSTVSIEWTSSGLDAVDVELLRSGSPVSTLATSMPDTGSLAWTIPVNLEAASDYRVRVSASAGGASDESDGDFTIELRQLTVATPNGGETVVGGEPLTIQWTSSDNITAVDVVLLADGVEQQTLATAIANDGNLSWSPPFDLPAASTYAVRVRDADSSVFDDSDAPFAVRNWQYRRAITITAPTTALTDWPVLVELDALGFDFGKANPGGSDIRFTTTPDRSSGIDLPHWIESWDPGAGARVWVRMPSVPGGASTTIYMFYGLPEATTTSSQNSVFPSRWVSTGNTTLGGSQSYDLFHLQAGHTLTIASGQVLDIDARIVIIEGQIAGTARGYSGGAVTTSGSVGSGPGGGAGSTTAGAGGGGHGGKGGNGGYDAADTVPVGGPANGDSTDTSVVMGSGGGSTDGEAGGAGGGAVSIAGHTVTVSGAITANGASGGGGSARNGGGGAGGGITITGYDVTVSSALQARGGSGGSGTDTANDGGGGGAGGRIKVLYDRNLFDTASRDVSGGGGGVYGDVDSGQAGAPGTSYTGLFAGIEPDVVTGTETALF